MAGRTLPPAARILRRVLLPLAVLLGLASGAAAQPALTAEITRAEELYVQGAYDDVTRLLAYAVNRETTDEQAVAVYRLLILSALKREAATEARLTVLRLLERLPDYAPDPVVDPPNFVAIVGEVRTILEAPPDAAATCTDALAAAEARYVEGAFGEAADVLQACLNQHLMYLATEEATTALRLLVLAHLQQGALPEARQGLVKLLEVDPAYVADPIQDPPAYAAFVNLIRRTGIAQQ